MECWKRGWSTCSRWNTAVLSKRVLKKRSAQVIGIGQQRPHFHANKAEIAFSCSVGQYVGCCQHLGFGIFFNWKNFSQHASSACMQATAYAWSTCNRRGLMTVIALGEPSEVNIVLRQHLALVLCPFSSFATAAVVATQLTQCCSVRCQQVRAGSLFCSCSCAYVLSQLLTQVHERGVLHVYFCFALIYRTFSFYGTTALYFGLPAHAYL